jgi:glycosyltransferase involved in cell wall biosynthesis
MVNKIDTLLQNNEIRETIGKNGLDLSKKHTYTKRCEDIIKIYNSL